MANGQAIEKVSYTHDALIDMVIASPHISQGQLAATFGYTQGWISQVMSSDAFRARLAVRKGELVDPVIAMSIDERLKAIAMKSAEVVIEKLSEPSPKPEFALKALETSSKALGYGAQHQGITSAPTPIEKLANNIVNVFQLGREELKYGRTYEANPTDPE